MSRADEDPILPAETEAALLEALEAALRPRPLDPATGERILQMALEDPLAAPTPDEVAESERLRDALATGAPHEADALLGALRASLGAARHDEPSVERALGRALGAGRARRGKVVYAWFGAASAALVAAAAIVIFVSPPREESPAASAAADGMVRPHSTTDLLADRFETSTTSERIDLIASARRRDLRDNRYAAWGVR